MIFYIKRASAVLLTALLLASCGAPKVSETTTVETTSACTTVCETTSPPKITVSPLASTDFLEPLEDFSWEREFSPEYVVLHFTSAAVISREDPYNIETVRGIFEDSGLSIHYIIDREGKVLCYMPESRAAWHAGKGTFAGDARLTDNMNKYSIGIEMLAIGSQRDMAQYFTKDEYRSIDKSLIGFTDAQYESVKSLVKDICMRNSIPFDKEHIIGHDMYNPSKSDPGELFDWERLFE